MFEQRWRTLGLACLALSLAAGCGSECNELDGSIRRGFDLSFDKVVVEYQEISGQLDALKVVYIRDPAGTPEIVARVIANAPVEEGQTKNISDPKDGGLSRAVSNGGQFPEIQSANITFDTIGEPGQEASGEFFITLGDAGSVNTLNGKFCATVERVSL